MGVILMASINDIIENIKTLGVFTYEQLEEELKSLPNMRGTANEVQGIVDRLPIRQVFEYYKYIGY